MEGYEIRPGAVALEIGALIDERWDSEQSRALDLIEKLPGITDFLKRSKVHERAAKRENFVLPAFLHPPQQYTAGKWPYTHFFIGTPAPVVLKDKDPLKYMTDQEAHEHYVARAGQTTDPQLRARYWDLAAMTVRGRTIPEVTRKAVSSLLEAASLTPIEVDDQGRFKLICRALELAVSRGLDEKVAEVRERIREELERFFSSYSFQVAFLLYGIAELDRKRVHLDYPTIADKYEALARTRAGFPRDERRKAIGFGSAFGVAYGIAKLTREPERIERLGRAHVEALIAFAEERREEGETGLNVRHWLIEALNELSSLPSCKDLRERILALLPDVAKQMESELTTYTHEFQLDDKTLEELEQARTLILEAGEDWPLTAAMVLVRFAPTRAESDEAGKSIFDGLVGRFNIGKGHVTATNGDDWRHRHADMLRSYLGEFLWRRILAPVLHELHRRRLIRLDLVARPFIERGLPDDDVQFLLSAASNLVTGDFIASTQLWTLMIERLIRFVVGALGGNTTAIRGGASSDSEAVFDSNVSQLERLYREGHPEHAGRLCNLLRYTFSWPGVGWNLRNNTAHGLLGAAEAGFGTAYLVYTLAVAVIAPLVLVPKETGEVGDSGEPPPKATAQTHTDDAMSTQR